MCILEHLATKHKYGDAQNFLGMHCIRCHNRSEEGIKWFLMAAKENKSTFAYTTLGNMYRAMGEYHEAKKYYNIAISLREEN